MGAIYARCRHARSPSPPAHEACHPIRDTTHRLLGALLGVQLGQQLHALAGHRLAVWAAEVHAGHVDDVIAGVVLRSNHNRRIIKSMQHSANHSTCADKNASQCHGPIAAPLPAYLGGAPEAGGRKEVNRACRGAKVHGQALGQQQQLVKHSENAGAGLMDCADDSSSIARQCPQRLHHILSLEGVQTCRQGCAGVYRGAQGCAGVSTRQAV